MSKTDLIEMEGLVTESLPSTMFKVKLDNDFKILAYPSGQIRHHHIKIWPGDRVKVGLSPYDLSKGRITYRFSKRELHKRELHPAVG